MADWRQELDDLLKHEGFEKKAPELSLEDQTSIQEFLDNIGKPAFENICDQLNSFQNVKGEVMPSKKLPNSKIEGFELSVFKMGQPKLTYRNWAAGGDEFALSINSLLNLFAFYKKDKHSWDNTFDFNFGYVKTTSLGSRKNDDRIDLLSKYGRAISSKWNVAALSNFRTQLLKGYNYPDNQKY